MKTAVIDYESYWSKSHSLSKKTTEEYINSDEFEVIGFAIKIGNEPTVWYTGDRDYLTKVLHSFDWANLAMVAHNCFFDASIHSLYFGIFPAKYIDTLSMARAVHGISVGGSLAKLATHYELGEKGTEVINALGKHRADFTKAELDAYGSYCINDVELTYALLQKLMPHFNTTELSLIDLTIKMGVVPRLEVDATMLIAHLSHIEALKQAHLDNVGLDRSELMSNNKFALLLEAQGIEAPLKLSATTGKMTYAFAKTDDGFKALLEHTNAEVAALASARLGVKSTLEETRTKRFMSIAGRIGGLRTIPNKGYGTLPIPLNYYGAATGRWSAGSGQKVNFQNLPRGSVIKEAIIAPKGYVIVGADLSNIELRVGMWVAGETEALKLLGEGGDLYKDFASKVFSVPYDEVTKDQRFIGKTSQLSLIFGVGSTKLRAAVKAGSGQDLPEAKEIVDLYRETYTGVTKFWSTCTKAIKNMAAPDSKVELEEFTFGPNGFFKAELDDAGVSKGIRLPSGLYMKYPELHLYKEDGSWIEVYQYKLRNGYDKLYGGKLTNNLVQGTARCIMSEAMVRVSKRYNIVLTIHDALYILVPEAEAEEALEFLMREMTQPPAWMPDIPLAAEGGYGKSLKEAG